MDHLQIKLCDIQGRLFALSRRAGYDSIEFIKAFMNSELAENLDSAYNRMQWAGEEYLLEELKSLAGDMLTQNGKQFDEEVLYWIGYLYRYWHYYTGEASRKIYRQASAAVMQRNYLIFHTMDPQLAVEDLKEIYRQKNS